MTNLYFFHLHACYSIFQNFFCAGIQFFVVLNSYKFSFDLIILVANLSNELKLKKSAVQILKYYNFV